MRNIIKHEKLCYLTIDMPRKSDTLMLSFQTYQDSFYLY